MKIINVLTNGILEGKQLGWENEFIKGIRMSRYLASWIIAGGDWHDENGFIEWMMNIPFEKEDGSISYISEGDAVDTYNIMTCGKCELETWAREYLAEHKQEKE